MSETLFYDPETLADCILENLKCPLLFVCITCYTARPSPLSLSPLLSCRRFAGLETVEMAIVGGKRRGTMEYQGDSARRYQRARGIKSLSTDRAKMGRDSRLTFIYDSSVSIRESNG